MDIWAVCEGEKYIKPLSVNPWRVVEAQHISSSRDLVDSLEEHDVLEAVLEASKPVIPNQKHYLIFTPFRYPPLQYGSRFGCLHEPSLWYGALKLQDAFTEVAYYRLQFFAQCKADLGYIEMLVTAFKAYLKTKHAVDLTQPPFNIYHDLISHKTTYEHSQAIGKQMREAGVEACLYQSARTRDPSTNIAAFTPNIFVKCKGQFISDLQNWSCMANKNTIEFTRADFLNKERLVFSQDDF